MNRFGQIRKWMNENRSHPVITITKEAPDDELSESGRCLKYAYELLDMIESPNEKAERLAVNGVSPETETPNPEQTVKPQPDSQFAPVPLLGDKGSSDRINCINLVPAINDMKQFIAHLHKSYGRF